MKRLLFFISGLLLAFSSVMGCRYGGPSHWGEGNGLEPSQFLEESPLLRLRRSLGPFPSVFESTKVSSLVLKRGLTLSALLGEQGFGSEDIFAIGRALSPFVKLNAIREGMRFDFFENLSGEINEIHVELSEFQKVSLVNLMETWVPQVENRPVTKVPVAYQGVVENSLWNSAVLTGVPPGLVSVFAELFSWQIDFSREIRPGDRWRFEVVEQRIDDRVVGWDPIPRAQYFSVFQNRSIEAYLFQEEGQDWGSYFDEKGQSLRRSFLRSPIPFGRVTSKFSRRRFHPIKKVYRPHNGIDYGAPAGTPIRAVAGGHVAIKGRTRGNGNWISLRHKGGYLTNYLHLQRFARGVTPGSHVEQGQVIGYVGQTGAATGPHLHFELKKNGRYLDPLNADLPRAEALKGEEKEIFLDWVASRRWSSLVETMDSN